MEVPNELWVHNFTTLHGMNNPCRFNLSYTIYEFRVKHSLVWLIRHWGLVYQVRTESVFVLTSVSTLSKFSPLFSFLLFSDDSLFLILKTLFPFNIFEHVFALLQENVVRIEVWVLFVELIHFRQSWEALMLLVKPLQELTHIIKD